MSTMSQSRARVAPAPTAGPFTAAMTGTSRATKDQKRDRLRLSTACAQVGVLLHLFDETKVASGAEGVTGSGEDDGAHLGLGGHEAHGRQHRRVQGTIEGVPVRRSVESEHPHP